MATIEELIKWDQSHIADTDGSELTKVLEIAKMPWNLARVPSEFVVLNWRKEVNQGKGIGTIQGNQVPI